MVMGGFSIHVPTNLPEARKFLPEGYNGNRFINCEGIEFLLEQEAARDEFPDMSEQEIESKSKANGLGKALVCVQALWFIAQCLTRRT